MSNSSSKLAAVAAFGDRYRKEHLDEPPDDPGEDEDPFRLRFLLKRAMASARNEETSAKYREATESVLIEHEDSIRKRWSESEEGMTDQKLLEALDDEGIGNERDRKMVVDILDLIGPLKDHDIIEHTIQEIETGSVDEVYESLDDVYNIGSKKATLFLRDVVTYWDLEDEIEGDQYRYLIPIDTWVFQIGDKFDIFSTDSEDWEINSQELIDACDEGLSPLAVDQGAWYLGANAFDVVIENLDDLEPKTDG